MAASPRIEPGAPHAHPHQPLPWEWHISARTLAIVLPARYRVLGWAPMGGGLRRAAVILNHQIALDACAAVESPRAYLYRLARSFGFVPRDTVAMMTGANVGRGGFATIRRRELAVSAWCSAGCSNALRVGDRATVVGQASLPVDRCASVCRSRLTSNPLGTINIAVAISRAVAAPVLAEAIQIAVEARVLAVQQAAVMSRRSGLPATGTGTDCIVVAAPDCTTKDRSDAIGYCGKHTVLGELIGRAVLRSCAAALSRRRD